MKGNYDEGFGKEQHKTKWAPATGGFEGVDNDTTAPSKVSHVVTGDRPEAPAEESVAAPAVEEPVAEEVAVEEEPAAEEEHTPEPVAEEVAVE